MKKKGDGAHWYQFGSGIEFKIVDGTISEFANQDCPILDWVGVTDEIGNPIPYSKEAAREFLRKFEFFRHWVSDCVQFPDESA